MVITMINAVNQAFTLDHLPCALELILELTSISKLFKSMHMCIIKNYKL